MSLSLAGKSNKKIISPNILHHSIHRISLLIVCVLFSLNNTSAQDSSGTVPVNIIRSGYGVHIATDTGEMDKLIGDVELEHEGTLMYCDSAYLRADINSVEAFGNVHIIQPQGTEVKSDYLKYTGGNRHAFLKGNVSLTDGKDHLWCETLNYNTATRIGTYDDHGVLKSDSTIVNSIYGWYNAITKDTRFTGDVHIKDPQYTVTSDDLGYNTNTKVVVFYGPSIVINDKSELRTKNGTWDSQNEKGYFIDRSSIENEAQYIEADTLDYDRTTGLGLAYGNVIAIDTSQETTLYSGFARYSEITQELMATIKPVMKKMNGNDSIFIRADTFYAAPIPPDTSLGAVAPIVKNDSLTSTDSTQSLISHLGTLENAADSSKVDSSDLRYFIGYYNVRIYSDSMQGKCDSISYSQKDSVMRMIGDPILWSRNSQITGDTIYLYTDSGVLNKMYVPNKALIVGQSGPDKAGMFDQIQGRRLIAYFENNAIKEMVVWPDAENIYYSTDDDGAYLGVNQSTSERMKILFNHQKISRIIFERNLKQSMTPLDQVDIKSLKLSRFRWHPDLRPKTKEELFD